MISKVTRSDYPGISLDQAVNSGENALRTALDRSNQTAHYTISYEAFSALQASGKQTILKILQDAPNPVTIENAVNAPIYICLHGFGGSEKSFDLLKKEMRAKGHIAVFYTLSLKGHGFHQDEQYEDKEDLSFAVHHRTPEQIIAHAKSKVSNLLKSKNIEGCTIIGHSIGGVIATALASDADLRSHIQRVICFNPAYYKPSLSVFKIFSRIDNYTIKKPHNTEKILYLSQRFIRSKKFEAYGKSFLRYFVKKRLHDCYGDKHNPNIDYFFDDYYQQALDPNFLRAFYNIGINLFRGDTKWIDDILESIDTPVHVFHGEKDKRFQWQKIEELCTHMTNGFFEIIEGLGHNPHEENPEAIAQKLLKVIQTKPIPRKGN